MDKTEWMPIEIAMNVKCPVCQESNPKYWAYFDLCYLSSEDTREAEIITCYQCHADFIATASIDIQTYKIGE